MNYTEFTKEWFKHSKLYLDDQVCKEFELLGLYDSSYKNDSCASFTLEIDDNKHIQLFLANSENDNIDNEEFNSSVLSYNDDENSIYEYIFESKDIWIIWSVIKSNFKYKAPTKETSL